MTTTCSSCGHPTELRLTEYVEGQGYICVTCLAAYRAALAGCCAPEPDEERTEERRGEAKR